MSIRYSPNDMEALKARLTQLNARELDQLRSVYQYRSVRTLALSTGQWNVFAGLLTLWLGLSGLHNSALHFFQAVIGALTVAISLWAVLRPTRQAVRAFAWLFLFSGVWNLFLAVGDPVEDLSILIGLLAIAQLWWAYRYYRRYRNEVASALSEVSSNLAQTYDQIWNAIAHTNPKIDTDFVEFQIGSNRWHGWLLGNLAVFALKRRRVVYLSHENAVAFEPHVTKLNKQKRFYITTRFDQVSGQGFIRRASFDRYAQWKLRNHPGASPDDFQLNGTGKVNWLPFGYLHPMIRIPLLIMGALFLIYVVFLIVAFIHYSQVGF